VQTKKIAVVAPAHNEADALPFFLADVEAFAVAQKMEVDLYLVDDHSTDQSAQIAYAYKAQLGERSTGVSIKHLPVSQWRGKTNAQATGLYEVSGNYDAIALMDSDGQHDPSQLVGFIQKMETTGAIVFGRRTSSYRRRFVASAGTSALDGIRKSLGLQATSDLGEYIVFPGAILKAVVSHPGLGVLPIVQVLLGLGFESTSSDLLIRPRTGNAKRTNFNFQALFTKGIHELLSEPWTYLPRLLLFVGLLAFAAMTYALAIGLQSIFDGNRNGVASIIALQVVFSVIGTSISILTMSILVLYIQSDQRTKVRVTSLDTNAGGEKY
jgi:glycosyltransferase involved in cell wall biosynthesis